MIPMGTGIPSKTRPGNFVSQFMHPLDLDAQPISIIEVRSDTHGLDLDIENHKAKGSKGQDHLLTDRNGRTLL